MILSFSRRNKVGARQYFQKRVSKILSTGGRVRGRGGMHGGGGPCVAGEHAWQGGVHGGGVHGKGGMRGRGGACMADTTRYGQ